MYHLSHPLTVDEHGGRGEGTDRLAESRTVFGSAGNHGNPVSNIHEPLSQ